MKLYRIAPLEWEASDISNTADTEFGWLRIYESAPGRWVFVNSHHASKHETLDAAKAAADTYYRDRLASALVPATSEDLNDAINAAIMATHRGSDEPYCDATCDGHIPSQRSFENRSDPDRTDRDTPTDPLERESEK